MNDFVRKPWDVPERLHTPIEVFQNRRQHRREFLKTVAQGSAVCGLGAWLAGCSRPTDEQLEQAGAADPLSEAALEIYPAERNPEFEYGRPETPKREVAEFTNFYEFSPSKSSWKYVGPFETSPWTLEIDGLCARPRTFDLDDLYREFAFEERAYRHRCVETWAMCVPWIGFRLRDLLRQVEPQSRAKYVAFETFNRPDQAPHMGQDLAGGRPQYPWPYTEGLTIGEAMNELTLLATGAYGSPLLKQNGAPVRLVVPWKYGYKSIKSIVRITLTARQPETFWNTVNPQEYGFESNVNPEIAHPRWSQRTEWMLGSRERYPTLMYNGYRDYVGELYA